MISVILGAALTAHLLFQTTGAHPSLPTASAILDRYVQVTHPAQQDGKFAVLTIDFSVTDAHGATYYATVFRDRRGLLHTAVDDDNNKHETGVAGGRVWTLSKPGARLMTGKAAARVMAETSGWAAGSLSDFATGWGGSVDSDDWHEAYSTVRTIGETLVRNQPCFEILLTRKDGSTLHRWYEVKSGLMARETTTEFDESGVEEKYETDIGNYKMSLGFVYPSVLYIKTRSSSFTVKINSVGRGVGVAQNGFELPIEVAKAVAQANTPEGMPNAVELIERFEKLTGADKARDAIHSEVMKANFSLADENLKVPVVLYAAGKKGYLSLDVPTMGKFEMGSNGEVAWQRSVVMGPQLLPRQQIGGLIGPDLTEILSWTAQDLGLRTIGKEAVNGTDCYVVEMSEQKSGTPAKGYFDAKSGYLLRIVRPAEAGQPAEQTTLGDYRAEDGFTIAHHIETSLAGKSVVIDMTEVRINAPLPEHVFDLPEDVVALVQHEKQTQPAVGKSATPPTLRRTAPQ